MHITPPYTDKYAKKQKLLTKLLPFLKYKCIIKA